MTRLFFILILLLHGCVSIPDHELATVACESGLENNAADAMESGDFISDGWPNPEWWKQFDDSVLNNLIESALSSSPTLKLAEERLKTAAQISIEKRAALFPEIAFDGNENYEHFSKYGFFRSVAPSVPPIVNDITLNLSYKWEIDFWGKYRDIFQAALGEVGARSAELDAAKLILTTSIAYDYEELQFMLRKKEILEQKCKNDLSIWKIRQRREKHAIDTALSVLGAQKDFLNAEALIVELDNQILKQLHELKALSGMGQNVQLDIPLKQLKDTLSSLPENISLDLLARRPDLAAQKQRVEAAAKLINAAKTDFYPSVNLIGFAGLESIHWNTIFQAASFNGSLDPSVHLPIFTAGRIKAQLMEKVAEFNEAVFSYNSLILQAAQEVADQLTTIIKIQDELVVRKISLDVVAKQEAITRARVEHAVDDKIVLLQAQNNLLDTQLIFTSLEYGKQLANILLIRSLGGGAHD